MIAHDVEFLVVGAYALAAFGFPAGDLRPEDLTNPDRILQMGVEPVQIRVMSAISGVTRDDAWAGRQSGRCGSRDLPFIGLREFVMNKRAAGRLKDLAVIEALGVK